MGELTWGLSPRALLASLAATTEYINLKAGGSLDVAPSGAVPFVLRPAAPVVPPLLALSVYAGSVLG